MPRPKEMIDRWCKKRARSKFKEVPFTFKKLEKTHIKHMFVYKPSEKESLYNIGILTDNLEFFQYEFTSYKRYNIVTQAAQRLRTIFMPYELDHASNVIIFDCIKDFKDPMYIYLSLLQPHIQFNLKCITIEKILNRILTYHQCYGAEYKKRNKVKRVPKTFFRSLWDKLVCDGKCPWITKEVNDELMHYASPKNRIRQIILRLGMYYMVIKDYLQTCMRKSVARKIAREQLQTLDNNDSNVAE